MKVYSEILSQKYKNELFNIISNDSENNTLIPLIDISKVSSNIDLEYFKNIFDGLLNHLSNIEKPLYTSRQDFLRHAYLNKEGEIRFHLKNDGESSTLMCGREKNDPFYDPNWKTCFYNYDNNLFSRIRKNLVSRFFIGINSNFYNSNNKKYYIKTISLENVSIEEFNKLFTPFKSQDGLCDKEKYIKYFRGNIQYFLDKIIISEEFKEDESDNKITEDTKNKKYTDISNSFSKEYFDEYGKNINSRPINAQYNSILQIGEILNFEDGFSRIVTKINLLNNPIKNHYLEIHTKLNID